MIRHFVMMTFLEADDATEAKTRLEDLTAHIPELLTLEVFLDVLHTDVSADLALITTHDNADTLKAYQQHPVHEAFGQWVRPRLSARVVVDAEV
jgi:hypothetical protein